MSGDQRDGKRLSQPARVINIKDAPPGWQSDPRYEYIGRAGKGLNGKWGNPFTVQEYGQGKACEQYAYWLSRPQQYALRAKMITELQGKILICFCKPKPCHGDVMAKVINGED